MKMRNKSLGTLWKGICRPVSPKTFLPSLVSGFQMPWLFTYVQFRGIQRIFHVSNAVHFYFNIHFPYSECLVYPTSNIKKTLSHIFKFYFCILGSNLTLVTGTEQILNQHEYQPQMTNLFCFCLTSSQRAFSACLLCIKNHVHWS